MADDRFGIGAGPLPSERVMKILLLHNHYQSGAPSGENTVFANERTLLQERGHEVITFERFNDDLAGIGLPATIRIAMESAWSPSSYEEVSRALRRTRPEVAHFHNTFPLISPSAYQACVDLGVAVVQTLHNYRLVCPSGLLFRQGKVCFDCLGRSPVPALLHRCYRGSLPGTAAVVWMLVSNRRRGTYTDLVDRYIVPSSAAASLLVNGGLPRKRMVVKPNFLFASPPPGDGGGGYAVYVGRLSNEKGVRLLIAAWRNIQGIPLKVIGDGALRAELESLSVREGLDIEFLGSLERDATLEAVRAARFLVAPSDWHETFGMVIIEAYACGTPVIAARMGAFDELVRHGETGLQFHPGDPADLVAQVQRLQNDDGLLLRMRAAARAEFEARYTADANYVALLGIYEAAIKARRQSGTGRSG